MKAGKPVRNMPVSRMPLSTLSRIVDSMTVQDIRETEKDVKRVFRK